MSFAQQTTILHNKKSIWISDGFSAERKENAQTHTESSGEIVAEGQREEVRPGEKWRMREKDREREEPTGRSLTSSDVEAAAAVIFPSGGNKVTLACVRTGDRRSGRLRHRCRPLLTRAAVSRGDRSEELLTGGPWHHAAPAPERCSVSTSFHRKLEWESSEGKKLPVSFLSHCSVTLFCYSTNPHVKDRQRHKILIRPGVSHIAFCCKGVSAWELSIDSLWRYTGIEVLDF